MSVGLMPANSCGIEAVDDSVDAFNQSGAVVMDSVALGQRVGSSIVAEGFIVLLDVVEVFAERISQTDLVTQRQRLRKQGFGAPEPGGIVDGHFAIPSEAVKRKAEARIDGDRSVKRCLR